MIEKVNKNDDLVSKLNCLSKIVTLLDSNEELNSVKSPSRNKKKIIEFTNIEDSVLSNDRPIRDIFEFCRLQLKSMQDDKNSETEKMIENLTE